MSRDFIHDEAQAHMAELWLAIDAAEGRPSESRPDDVSASVGAVRAMVDAACGLGAPEGALEDLAALVLGSETEADPSAAVHLLAWASRSVRDACNRDAEWKQALGAARRSIWESCTDLLVALGRDAAPWVARVREAVTAGFPVDVRQHSMAATQSLLALTWVVGADAASADSLCVADLLRTVLGWLDGTSVAGRLRDTADGSARVLAGRVVQRFSRSLPVEDVHAAFKLMMATLAEQRVLRRGTQRERVIEGCVEALRLMLQALPGLPASVSASDRRGEAAFGTAVLFRDVLLQAVWVEPSGDSRARLRVPLAAMRMLSSHASLFGPLLARHELEIALAGAGAGGGAPAAAPGPDGPPPSLVSLLERLQACRRLRNRPARLQAGAAFEAVSGVLASAASGSACEELSDAEREGLFRALYSRLGAMLEGRGGAYEAALRRAGMLAHGSDLSLGLATVRAGDIRLAVRGFGRLGPRVLAQLGVAKTRAWLERLMTLAEQAAAQGRAFRGGDEDGDGGGDGDGDDTGPLVGDAQPARAAARGSPAVQSRAAWARHNSECLQAFARLARALPRGAVTPAMVEHLSRMASGLVSAFPSLAGNASARRECLRALWALLASLDGSGAPFWTAVRAVASAAVEEASLPAHPELRLTHPGSGRPEGRQVFEVVPLVAHLAGPVDPAVVSAVAALLSDGRAGPGPGGEDSGEEDGAGAGAAAAGSSDEEEDAGATEPADGGRSDDDGSEAPSSAESVLAARSAMRRIGRRVLDETLARVLASLRGSDLGLVAAAATPGAAVDRGEASAAVMSVTLSGALTQDGGGGGGGGGGPGATSTVDGAGAGAAPAVVPRSPASWSRFLTMADFVVCLLPLVPRRAAAPWCERASEDLLTLSARFPHVSAVYKLAGAWARHCPAPGPAGPGPAAAALRLLSSAALDRCRQYRGETLTAAISFLLAVPPEVSGAALSVRAVAMALQVGGGSHAAPRLLEDALSALERWREERPWLFRAQAERLAPALGRLLEGTTLGEGGRGPGGGGADDDDDDDAVRGGGAGAEAEAEEGTAVGAAGDGEGVVPERLAPGGGGEMDEEDGAPASAGVLRSRAEREAVGSTGTRLASRAQTLARRTKRRLMGAIGLGTEALDAMYSTLQLCADAVASSSGLTGEEDADDAAVGRRRRRRVARLLASMGGDAHLAVEPASVTLPPRLSPPGSDGIRVRIPLSGKDVEVALAPLLPRIVALAEGSAGDRQSRSAACELLHAVVLLVLGRNDDAFPRSPHGPVLRRLVPTALRLATDAEPIARQLFAPLCSQLTRYYATTAAGDGDLEDDRGAFVDAVCERLASPDAASRDLGAHCFGQLVVWGLRTAPAGAPRGASGPSAAALLASARSPASVPALLRRLIALARHPSPFSRLGAAVVVGSSHRWLREQPAAAGPVLYPLLEAFVVSLRMADADPAALGTAPATALAVDALSRVARGYLARVRAGVLDAADLADPEGASGEPGTGVVSGASRMAEWLLLQAGGPASHARRRCLALLDGLCPVLPRGAAGTAAAFAAAAVASSRPAAALDHRLQWSECADGTASGGAAAASSDRLGGVHALLHALQGAAVPLPALPAELPAALDGSLSDAATGAAVAAGTTFLRRAADALDALRWAVRRGVLRPADVLAVRPAVPAPSRKRGRAGEAAPPGRAGRPPEPETWAVAAAAFLLRSVLTPARLVGSGGRSAPGEGGLLDSAASADLVERSALAACRLLVLGAAVLASAPASSSSSSSSSSSGAEAGSAAAASDLLASAGLPLPRLAALAASALAGSRLLAPGPVRADADAGLAEAAAVLLASAARHARADVVDACAFDVAEVLSLACGACGAHDPAAAVRGALGLGGSAASSEDARAARRLLRLVVALQRCDGGAFLDRVLAAAPPDDDDDDDDNDDDSGLDAPLTGRPALAWALLSAASAVPPEADPAQAELVGRCVRVSIELGVPAVRPSGRSVLAALLDARPPHGLPAEGGVTRGAMLLSRAGRQVVAALANRDAWADVVTPLLRACSELADDGTADEALPASASSSSSSSSAAAVAARPAASGRAAATALAALRAVLADARRRDSAAPGRPPGRSRLASPVRVGLGVLEALPALAAWSEAAAPDAHARTLLAVLRRCAEVVPWGIAAPPGGKAGAAPSTLHIPAQAVAVIRACAERTLGPAAAATLQADALGVFGRFALPSFAPGAPVPASGLTPAQLASLARFDEEDAVLALAPAPGPARIHLPLVCHVLRLVATSVVGRHLSALSSHDVLSSADGATVEQRRAYDDVLARLLRLLADHGSLLLLARPVLGRLLEEGQAHAHAPSIDAALRATAEALPSDGPGVPASLGILLSFALPPLAGLADVPRGTSDEAARDAAAVALSRPALTRRSGARQALLLRPAARNALLGATLVPYLQRLRPAALRASMTSPFPVALAAAAQPPLASGPLPGCVGVPALLAGPDADPAAGAEATSSALALAVALAGGVLRPVVDAVLCPSDPPPAGATAGHLSDDETAALASRASGWYVLAALFDALPSSAFVEPSIATPDSTQASQASAPGAASSRAAAPLLLCPGGVLRGKHSKAKPLHKAVIPVAAEALQAGPDPLFDAAAAAPARLALRRAAWSCLVAAFCRTQRDVPASKGSGGAWAKFVAAEDDDRSVWARLVDNGEALDTPVVTSFRKMRVSLRRTLAMTPPSGSDAAGGGDASGMFRAAAAEASARAAAAGVAWQPGMPPPVTMDEVVPAVDARATLDAFVPSGRPRDDDHDHDDQRDEASGEAGPTGGGSGALGGAWGEGSGHDDWTSGLGGTARDGAFGASLDPEGTGSDEEAEEEAGGGVGSAEPLQPSLGIGSIAAAEAAGDGGTDPDAAGAGAPDTALLTGGEGDVVTDVELDGVGRNPAFATALRLVDEMAIIFAHELRPAAAAAAGGAASSSSASVGAAAAVPPPSPKWVRSVLANVTGVNNRGRSIPLATRVFVARVVMARPEVFEPWAPDVGAALVQLAADLSHRAGAQRLPYASPVPGASGDDGVSAVLQRDASPGVSYLVRDLCCLLAGWGGRVPMARASTAAAASDLLSWLVRSAANRLGVPGRGGAGGNKLWGVHMSLVRGLVESWAPQGVRLNKRAFLPLTKLADHASHSPRRLSPGDRCAATALDALLATVATGQPVWDSALDEAGAAGAARGGLTAPRFFEWLCRGATMVTARVPSPHGAGVVTKPAARAVTSRYAELAGLALGVDARRRRASGAPVPGDTGVTDSDAAATGPEDAVRFLLLPLRAALLAMPEAASAGSRVNASSAAQRFLDALHSAAQHYPRVVDGSVLSAAFSLVGTGRGAARVVVLARIAAVASLGLGHLTPADRMDAFRRLRPHLGVLISSSVPRVVDGVLRLLRVVSRDAPPADLARLIRPGSQSSLSRVCAKHPSALVRASWYTLLVELWDGVPGFRPPSAAEVEDAAAASSAGGADSDDDGETEADGDEAAAPEETAPGDPARPTAARGEWRLVLRFLLAGLQDPSRRLRLRLYAWWDSDRRLPAAPEDRLEGLVASMFDPAQEGAWLRYAPHLLLALAARSKEFHEPLLKSPLRALRGVPEAAAAESRPVSTAWADASTAALFASSLLDPASRAAASLRAGGRRHGALRALASQFGAAAGAVLASQLLDGHGGADGGAGPGGNLLFQATQAGGGHATVGADGAPERAAAAGAGLQSSFLPASLQQAGLLGGARRILGAATLAGTMGASQPGQGAATYGAASSAAPSSALLHAGPRVRFDPGASSSASYLLRSQAASSTGAQKLVRYLESGSRRREGERRHELWRRQRQRMAVRTYRRYRPGGLPGVTFPLKDLVAPLRALVEADASLAGAALQELWRGVYASQPAAPAQSPGRRLRLRLLLSGALDACTSDALLVGTLLGAAAAMGDVDHRMGGGGTGRGDPAADHTSTVASSLETETFGAGRRGRGTATQQASTQNPPSSTAESSLAAPRAALFGLGSHPGASLGVAGPVTTGGAALADAARATAEEEADGAAGPSAALRRSRSAQRRLLETEADASLAFPVSPRVVRDAAQRCGAVPAAIRLLEAGLVRAAGGVNGPLLDDPATGAGLGWSVPARLEDDEAAGVRRGKPVERSDWWRLANRTGEEPRPAATRSPDEAAEARAAIRRLYGDVDEAAHLSLLLARSAHPETRRAAALEAQGHTQQALEAYSAALTKVVASGRVPGRSPSSSSSAAARPARASTTAVHRADSADALEVLEWQHAQTECHRRLEMWGEVGAGALHAVTGGTSMLADPAGAASRLLRAAARSASLEAGALSAGTAVLGERYRGATVHLVLEAAWRERCAPTRPDVAPTALPALADAILAAASADSDARAWLRATAPLPVALLLLAGGERTAARAWADAALDAVPGSLAASSPLSAQLRHRTLRDLVLTGQVDAALAASRLADRVKPALAAPGPLSSRHPSETAVLLGTSRPVLRQLYDAAPAAFKPPAARGPAAPTPPLLLARLAAVATAWRAASPHPSPSVEPPAHHLRVAVTRSALAGLLSAAVERASTRGVAGAAAAGASSALFAACEWSAQGGLALIARQGFPAEALVIARRSHTDAKRRRQEEAWPVRLVAAEAELYAARAALPGALQREKAGKQLRKRLQQARELWAQGCAADEDAGSEGPSTAAEAYSQARAASVPAPDALTRSRVSPAAVALLRGGLAADVVSARTAGGSTAARDGAGASPMLLHEALAWLRRGVILADVDATADEDEEDAEGGGAAGDAAGPRGAKRSRAEGSGESSPARSVGAGAAAPAPGGGTPLRLCAGDGAAWVDAAEAHLRLAAFCTGLLADADGTGEGGEAGRSAARAVLTGSADEEATAAPEAVVSAAAARSILRACALGHDGASLRLGTALFLPVRGSPEARGAAAAELRSRSRRVPTASWLPWSAQATAALFAALQAAKAPGAAPAASRTGSASTVAPSSLSGAAWSATTTAAAGDADPRTAAVRALAGVLGGVADARPQALHPPFRVTFDDAVDPWDDGLPGDSLGPVLGPMWARLRHPTVEACTDAMDGLTASALRLYDDLRALQDWMKHAAKVAGAAGAAAERAQVGRRVRRLLLRSFGSRPSSSPLSAENELFARGLVVRYASALCAPALERMREREGAAPAPTASSSRSRPRASRGSTEADGLSLTLLEPEDFAGPEASLAAASLTVSGVARLVKAASADRDAWTKSNHRVQLLGRTSAFRRLAEHARREGGGETLAELSPWLAGYNALDLPPRLRLDVFGAADAGGVWGAEAHDAAASGAGGPGPAAHGSPATGTAGALSATIGEPTAATWSQGGSPAPRRRSTVGDARALAAASASVLASAAPAPHAPASLSLPTGPGSAGAPFVVCFSESVLTLRSIRKPRRVTAYGSDERPRRMLVKAGEDLRLDQRVETVFGLVNRAAADRGAAGTGGTGASALLPTYGVLPLTPRVGAIEWVPNTRPLRDAVLSTPRAKTAFSDATKVRDAWLRRYEPKGGKGLHSKDTYLRAYRQAPADEAREVFRALLRAFPRGALLAAARASAADPQALLALRSRFASSLAASSLACWVLGVGDRHPDNFLLSGDDWSLVPIDFGYAFGFATSHLPVPELIPFRASPALLDVMSPLDPRTLLAVHMASLLKSLRREPWRGVLADTLDLFVREPTMDWRRPAAAGAQAQTDGTDWAAPSGVSAMAGAGSAARSSRRSRSARSSSAAEGAAGAATMVGDDDDGDGPMMSTLDDDDDDEGADEAATVRAAAASEAATDVGSTAADAAKAIDHIDDTVARRKIATVRRKLGLWHPTAIMAEEVRSNPHCCSDPRVLEGVLGALHGAHGSARAMAVAESHDRSATVEANVEALIDLATDGNVLARQWQGLALFL